MLGIFHREQYRYVLNCLIGLNLTLMFYVHTQISRVIPTKEGSFNFANIPLALL